MSEPKHTPGPWRVDTDPNGKPHFWIKRGGGFVIARVSGNGEPDARLIASAPDLLAALEEALPVVEACHEVPPTRANLIRAAIAKAYGR